MVDFSYLEYGNHAKLIHNVLEIFAWFDFHILRLDNIYKRKKKGK